MIMTHAYFLDVVSGGTVTLKLKQSWTIVEIHMLNKLRENVSNKP